MLYSQMGICLQRDSGLQAKDPRFIKISKEALEEGDLLFLGESCEKIRHVGMYLGKGKFIHATARVDQPWIRINELTDPAWSEICLFTHLS